MNAQEIERVPGEPPQISIAEVLPKPFKPLRVCLGSQDEGAKLGQRNHQPSGEAETYINRTLDEKGAGREAGQGEPKKMQVCPTSIYKAMELKQTVTAM